jgi:hypothetical protein
VVFFIVLEKTDTFYIFVGMTKGNGGGGSLPRLGEEPPKAWGERGPPQVVLNGLGGPKVVLNDLGGPPLAQVVPTIIFIFM